MMEIKAMFPVVVVENLEPTKAFYETTFGFTSVFYQEGFYLHLMQSATGVQLGFMVPNHPTQPEFLHPVMHPEGYVISFEVADADLQYQQAQEANLDIAMPIKTEQWGQKHFMVKDPAGIKIDIIEAFEPEL